jgi:hypothetical protein
MVDCFTRSIVPINPHDQESAVMFKFSSFAKVFQDVRVEDMDDTLYRRVKAYANCICFYYYGKSIHRELSKPSAENISSEVAKAIEETVARRWIEWVKEVRFTLEKPRRS